MSISICHDEVQSSVTVEIHCDPRLDPGTRLNLDPRTKRTIALSRQDEKEVPVLVRDNEICAAIGIQVLNQEHNAGERTCMKARTCEKRPVALPQEHGD